MPESPLVSPAAAQPASSPSFVRKLGLGDLIALGIGSIMGTGVFVLTGSVAAHAGPGVMLSFVLAAICAALAAMCYAEMAGMVPPAVGSAYLYARATLSPQLGFLLGWILALIYVLGAATLAVGFSGYTASLCARLGAALPAALTQAPLGIVDNRLVTTGVSINLPAAAIVVGLAMLLNRGLVVSARLTALLVAIKVAVVLVFVAVMLPHVDPARWVPMVPPNRGTFGDLGVSGIMAGSVTLFFSYMGFDAVSAAAAEAKRPHRDLPLAILCALGVCAALYVLTAAVLTGVVPYAQLDVAHPLARAAAVSQAAWLEPLIDVGAIFGLMSVLMAQLFVQPRIVVAMAQDGFLPRSWARLHPVRRVPLRLTWAGATAAAILGALVPVGALGEFTSVGILLMFAVVSAGVMVARVRQPTRPRSFVVPLGPFVIPGLSLAMCAGLMLCARSSALMQMALWLLLGAAMYRRRTYTAHS